MQRWVTDEYYCHSSKGARSEGAEGRKCYRHSSKGARSKSAEARNRHSSKGAGPTRSTNKCQHCSKRAGNPHSITARLHTPPPPRRTANTTWLLNSNASTCNTHTPTTRKPGSRNPNRKVRRTWLKRWVQRTIWTATHPQTASRVGVFHENVLMLHLQCSTPRRTKCSTIGNSWSIRSSRKHGRACQRTILGDYSRELAVEPRSPPTHVSSSKNK